MQRKVVGLHAAKAVFEVRPRAIQEVFLRRDFERSQELKQFAHFAKTRNLKIQVRDEGFFDKIAFSHQGVCLVVDEAPELDEASILAPGPCTLIALDEITDPHNLGAIIRTAWLLGAKGIYVPEVRSAHLTPAVCKVASGGAEYVPVIPVSNLARELNYLKDKGFWAFALDGKATKSIGSLKFPDKILWVIGSEDKGIRSPILKACDEVVSIPIATKGASFNASVAAAMALFETARQHGQLGAP
jgi:23S rRNA (guanosine2251-2'-O)-methyltransferase